MATRASRGVRLALLTEVETQFTNCVLEIYTGGPPANADLAETGTLLALLTLDGGAFTGGVGTNGLNFDIGDVVHADGYSILPKDSTETWKGLGLATGVAGWGRLHANAYTKGASTTAVRIDGLCGRSNAQFILSDLNIAVGEEVVCQSCNITLPAY